MALGATTVAAIGSSLLGLAPLAIIFGGTGMVLGGVMAAEDLNQSGINLDATQAGQAGGQRLTNQNPYAAQMAYQLAMVNVGLSLLDAGVAVRSIRQVLTSRSAVQALARLKPNQLTQFSEATRLGNAGKAEEAQKLLQSLKGEVDAKTFQELERAWQKALGTEAKLGDLATSYSLRTGTVRMQLHPGYSGIMQRFQEAGFEVVNSGSAGLEVVEIIDKATGKRTMRRILHVKENMRFLDLEHEYGHLQQLQRLGNPPLSREIRLPNGNIVDAKGNDLQGIVNARQNTILEYHNRLKEYMRLRARGASPELLQEHAQGIADWKLEAYGKGKLSNSGSSERRWAQENFPELFELENKYRNLGGNQTKPGLNPGMRYGS
jgi:hypothetical protein